MTTWPSTNGAVFYVSFALTCIPGLAHLPFYTAIVLSTENFTVSYHVRNLLFFLAALQFCATRYIVISNAVLWQHVATTLHYDVSLLIISTKV